VIGGSGFYEFMDDVAEVAIDTPYGAPSADIAVGSLAGTSVAFLPRHGKDHAYPPHLINYRANIWALREKQVTRIIAVCTVGAIDARLASGSLALPDQIIDYTWGRPSTYFEGAEQPVTHIDFTYPFCEETRGMARAAAAEEGVALQDGGTYAAVQGPRLETRAEIDRLERDGATMVGMTCMPEAALARELQVSYAALAVVVNAAAGRGESLKRVALDDIARIIDESMAKVRLIVAKVVERHGGS